jgi:hypothetical protein
MWKCFLTIVCSVMFLTILNVETTEARPPSGGRSGNRASPRPPRNVQPPKHVHHHKHKHKNTGSADVDVDVDSGSSADEIDGDDAEMEEADGALYGMEIIALYKGTAAEQGLEIGDIILSINGMATPDYNALANAVARSGSEAKVLVIRDEGGARETVTLYPKNGRIGLAGERMRVDE